MVLPTAHEMNSNSLLESGGVLHTYKSDYERYMLEHASALGVAPKIIRILEQTRQIEMAYVSDHTSHWKRQKGIFSRSAAR